MAASMKEFKCRMLETDLAAIDRAAIRMGVSRAELIRNRTLANGSAETLAPADFHRIVADAQKFMGGIVDRRATETLVSFVFSRLAKSAVSS